MSDQSSRLRTQTLARPLTPEEIALAAALEKAYVDGAGDFDAAAAALTAASAKVPSDGTTKWTAAILERELKSINQSLDEAYAKHGRGA
jgi:hypothetical protein